MEPVRKFQYENTASHEADIDYEILNSPELRAEYITYTDGLISKIVQAKADVVIYLDKSARPVAWLVNELWDTMAPIDPQTNMIMKKPETKFLNIDREQWQGVVGRSENETGGINVNAIPESNIDELRQVFATVPGKSRPEDSSMLSNKNVLVVDEVRSSGDTLKMSEGIIKRAFPDAARVDGEYWMLKPAHRDASSGMMISGEVPIWYSDETNKGRLVANRDTTKSNASNSSRQRIGGQWLSTRFRNGPDEAGRQLKREVKRLALDLKQHDIPYIHSPMWDSRLEPLPQRIARLNGLEVSEYAKLKQAAGDSTSEFIKLYHDYRHDKEEYLSQ